MTIFGINLPFYYRFEIILLKNLTSYFFSFNSHSQKTCQITDWLCLKPIFYLQSFSKVWTKYLGTYIIYHWSLGFIWQYLVVYNFRSLAVLRYLIRLSVHESEGQQKLFLSSPIACAACERRELLRTEITVIQMEVIYELCISFSFYA